MTAKVSGFCLLAAGGLAANPRLATGLIKNIHYGERWARIKKPARGGLLVARTGADPANRAQPSSSAPIFCIKPKLLTKGLAMRGSFIMAL